MRYQKFIVIAVLLIIFVWFFTACNTTGNDETDGEPSYTETTSAAQNNELPSLKLSKLGTPYSTLAEKARMPWDMAVYNGFLYVGAGNYSENISPRSVLRYNLTTFAWKSCGNVRDEQINRFLLINGILTIPGTDPMDDWSYGNFYALEDDTFKMHRVIPNAVHTFDMVEYDGRIFTGNGVVAGRFPVSVAVVGSDNFTEVPFYKNGERIDTSAYTEVRVYDLFVFKNAIYAFLTLDTKQEIYRYEDEHFVYDNKWTNKVIWIRDNAFVPIRAKAVTENYVYFSSGLLYATDDMRTLGTVSVGDTDRILDIVCYEDNCYALGYRKTETGEYENQIYALSGSEGLLVSTFMFDSPAISFTRDSENWYFGFGAPRVGQIYKAAVLPIS